MLSKLFPHPFKEDIKLIDFDDNNEIFYGNLFGQVNQKALYHKKVSKKINSPLIDFRIRDKL
ncbi:MAG: hypothetical protein U0T78_02240 [Cloacibacterium normanense]